jgi:hypothetical protein
MCGSASALLLRAAAQLYRGYRTRSSVVLRRKGERREESSLRLVMVLGGKHTVAGRVIIADSAQNIKCSWNGSRAFGDY